MTVLYRGDPAEPPQFGSRTFWTTRKDSAEYLAQLEAATPTLPPPRVYWADLTIGDDVVEQAIDDLLRLVRDKPNALQLLRDGLLGTAAHAGRQWMQLTDDGRSWKGAMIYMGDEPVPAQLAPKGSSGGRCLMAEPHDDDPLMDAEMQMAQEELSVVAELMMKISRRLGLSEREDIPTQAEFREAACELTKEDPDVRELFTRLATKERFRNSGEPATKERFRNSGEPATKERFRNSGEPGGGVDG
jgi:hypothetical protein